MSRNHELTLPEMVDEFEIGVTTPDDPWLLRDIRLPRRSLPELAEVAKGHVERHVNRYAAASAIVGIGSVALTIAFAQDRSSL